MNTLDAEQQDANDPASRIAALLLAKLADYVVPGKPDATKKTLSNDLFAEQSCSNMCLPLHFFPLYQAVRRYSPPAPRSQTPVCLALVPKGL